MCDLRRMGKPIGRRRILAHTDHKEAVGVKQALQAMKPQMPQPRLFTQRLSSAQQQPVGSYARFATNFVLVSHGDCSDSCHKLTHNWCQRPHCSHDWWLQLVPTNALQWHSKTIALSTIDSALLPRNIQRNTPSRYTCPATHHIEPTANAHPRQRRNERPAPNADVTLPGNSSLPLTFQSKCGKAAPCCVNWGTTLIIQHRHRTSTAMWTTTWMCPYCLATMWPMSRPQRSLFFAATRILVGFTLRLCSPCLAYASLL